MCSQLIYLSHHLQILLILAPCCSITGFELRIAEIIEILILRVLKVRYSLFLKEGFPIMQ